MDVDKASDYETLNPFFMRYFCRRVRNIPTYMRIRGICCIRYVNNCVDPPRTNNEADGFLLTLPPSKAAGAEASLRALQTF